MWWLVPRHRVLLRRGSSRRVSALGPRGVVLPQLRAAQRATASGGSCQRKNARPRRADRRPGVVAPRLPPACRRLRRVRPADPARAAARAVRAVRPGVSRVGGVHRSQCREGGGRVQRRVLAVPDLPAARDGLHRPGRGHRRGRRKGEGDQADPNHQRGGRGAARRPPPWPLCHHRVRVSPSSRVAAQARHRAAGPRAARRLGRPLHRPRGLLVASRHRRVARPSGAAR
mmetsp:Transcript_41845/g.138754  ORF Transcript_41845/g.138754 Transcript_41845/m.138754 type:complete len:229 (-) Transcript_41845:753-1439(-)